MESGESNEMQNKISEKVKSSLLHRNVLGALGMLLPIISILGGFLVKNKTSNEWWYSISVTYYITPALAVILGSCGIFLLCYRSYEKIDTVINVLSGIAALVVVLFPCDNPYGYEYVGFFQLPVKVSNIVHLVAAFVLFGLLIANIAFLFTKGKSKKRNVIYKVCAHVMLIDMTCLGISAFFKNTPGWSIMIAESILLFSFGIAWLTKGRFFFRNLKD